MTDYAYEQQQRLAAHLEAFALSEINRRHVIIEPDGDCHCVIAVLDDGAILPIEYYSFISHHAAAPPTSSPLDATLEGINAAYGVMFDHFFDRKSTCPLIWRERPDLEFRSSYGRPRWIMRGRFALLPENTICVVDDYDTAR